MVFPQLHFIEGGLHQYYICFHSKQYVLRLKKKSPLWCQRGFQIHSGVSVLSSGCVYCTLLARQGGSNEKTQSNCFMWSAGSSISGSWPIQLNKGQDISVSPLLKYVSINSPTFFGNCPLFVQMCKNINSEKWGSTSHSATLHWLYFYISTNCKQRTCYWLAD